jgi:hypothetical protein
MAGSHKPDVIQAHSYALTTGRTWGCLPSHANVLQKEMTFFAIEDVEVLYQLIKSCFFPSVHLFPPEISSFFHDIACLLFC